MNWRSVRAITLKDLKGVRQNKAAWVSAVMTLGYLTGAGSIVAAGYAYGRRSRPKSKGGR